MCDDVQLCNRCVCEFLNFARTWFAFGLPSKTTCDNLEALDYKRHFLIIETNRLNFCYLVRKCLLVGHRFERNGLRLVVWKRSVSDVVDVASFAIMHSLINFPRIYSGDILVYLWFS
jgi:hypothetical protein